MKEKLKIIPLGGLNEIGKNMTVIEYGNDIMVIDCGVALHNMHAPWEISSKADIYETTRGYQAFLKHAK